MKDIENIKETAKEILKRNGAHQPQFIFIKNKKGTIILTPFSNNKEKELMKKAMRTYVEENKPDYYFYIAEAWYLEQKIDELDLSILPSQSSERKEVLIIEKYSKDMKNESISIRFHKEKGRIIFDGEDSINKMESSFNFYIEEGAFDERIENMKVKICQKK